MNNKLTNTAAIIGIISGILVIGGFILGQDFIKNYISSEIGYTKESLDKHTEELRINTKLLEKRSNYLEEIRSYYINRLTQIDKELIESKQSLNKDSSMISTLYDSSGHKESVKSHKLIIENLIKEKEQLLKSLSKFIDKNPDLLK